MGKDKKSKISLFFLLSYIVLIPLINGFMKILEKCFNTNLNTIDINFLNLFTVIFRNGTIFIIWVILNLIIILVAKNISTTKHNAKIEVEGVNLKKKDGTFGTADWGNKQEIQEYLSIGKRDGIILGETDEQEIITLPMNTYLNKNIAVFGSSGSKKSRGFAIPNGIELVQEEVQEAIQRQMSLVFTDPKGELYRKLAKYLETKGYDVEVFNLVNPTFSNGARFINFVEDETDAQIFSQIVIEGTQLSRRSSGDEFWNRGEQNLLKALLLYVINYVKKEEDKSMGFIYDALASGNIKNIPICLNRALFRSFSSTPIFLNILYFSVLSLDSDNSLRASIAAQDIKKIIPRYNPKKVTMAPRPTEAFLISCFVFIVNI